jgi:hypothetical protein
MFPVRLGLVAVRRKPYVIPAILLAVAAAILLTVAVGLRYVIVPLVDRFGLTITTLGGTIACASAAATAVLLVGGLATTAGAIP